MTDRGTLIAGAGIALACLIAGVGFLFFRADEAARARTEEAHHAEAMQRQADAMAQRFDVNRKMDQQLIVARQPIEALAVGTSDLVNRQSPDGAWRSDTYATFKSGTALTPLVVVALQKILRPPAEGPSPVHGGCDFLAKLVKPDGSIEGADGEIDYPVYTAALTVVALSHPTQAKHAKARDAWLRFLLDRQLTESNGWQPADKAYGGWGYCRLVPKKPAPGAIAPPLVESNLSATVFALEELKAAGVKDRAPFEKALAFVRRCQNFLPREGGVMLPEAYDDGGFTFIYDDAVRNKAGAILPRASSRDQFLWQRDGGRPAGPAALRRDRHRSHRRGAAVATKELQGGPASRKVHGGHGGESGRSLLLLRGVGRTDVAGREVADRVGRSAGQGSGPAAEAAGLLGESSGTGSRERADRGHGQRHARS